MRNRTLYILSAVGVLLLINIVPPSARTSLSDDEIRAIHHRLLTVDSHTDIGPGFGTARLDPAILNNAQVNLPSMRSGGLDASFFIVFTPQGETNEEGLQRARERAEEKYRGIMRMVQANPQIIGLARSADEVENLNAEGKLIALIGIENAYPLGNTSDEVVEAVKIWAKRGAQYVSLTHFGHNQFGGSSNPSLRRNDGADPGLSELGRVLVKALNDRVTLDSRDYQAIQRFCWYCSTCSPWTRNR